MPNPATSAETKPTCEGLLRTISAAGPAPWHARAYAAEHAADRDQLEELLTELRLSGIIQLTDWQKDTGQGYRVTDYGREVLANPVMMERLKGPFESQGTAAKREEPVPRAERPATPLERGERARGYFLGPKKVAATNILIALNLLAFAACAAECVRLDESLPKFLLGGNAEVIQKMGGLTASGIARGRWMSVVTSGFLHFGLIHLAMNMAALGVMGRFLETAWGSGRFVAIYMLAVLGGSTACLLFNPGPTLVAGASGGIWGLFGAQLVWLLFNWYHLTPQMLRASLNNWLLAFGVNLCVSFLPNISIEGHLGGFVIGGVAAALLQLHWRYGPTWKSLAFALLSVLPIACILSVVYETRHSGEWRAIVEEAKREPGN